MKIDKRITKCIIAATVVIAIVVTAPVLSSASVALAQKPKTAKLTIENFISANCSYEASRCPGGEKHGHTTITISAGGGKPPSTIEFPAGYWGKETFLTPPPEIPVGTEYYITTTVPEPSYHFSSGGTVHYTHVDTFIAGKGLGACSGHYRCDATMGPDGATYRVAYYWRHDFAPYGQAGGSANNTISK